jgi:NTE family protein
VNQPFDATLLENDLAAIAGLDRYESVGWQLVQENGQPGLRIHARPKTHAPPFLMLGVSLQNTTSDEFAFQLAARFLAFDVLGSGSELRLDGAVGVQPRIGAELYRPIGRSPLFVAATALANDTTLNFISDDTIVAKYGEVRAGGGLGVGVNLGRYDEVRLTFIGGQLEASVEAGNPGLPDVSGTETRGQLRWLHDGQDSPVVPAGGVRSEATLDYIFDSPEVPDVIELNRTNDDLIQTEFTSSAFWSLGRANRLFLVAGAGTSFERDPLPTEQFELGRPFFLGAHDVGQLRGDHYGLLTAGYMRAIGRLPDFIGGSIFVGAWLENGTVFSDVDDAGLETDASIGTIADTLIGPIMLGASFGFEGGWRYYVGIGRLY